MPLHPRQGRFASGGSTSPNRGAGAGWLALMLILAAPGVGAAEHYQGNAYAQDDGHLSYREEHWLFDDRGVPARLVLYRCPDGAPFARKWVHQVAPGYAPDFDLLDARDGYREGVHRQDGQLSIYVQKSASAATSSTKLPVRADAVADAGFDDYVRAHWNQLAAPDGSRVAFLLPSRQGYLDLRLDGAHDGQENGQPVRHLRMSLDTWFGFVAPSIDLTYTMAGHQLLRFEGISNVRDAHGKNQRVRIEFPASARFAAPNRAEIDAAAALPLVARCSG